MVSPFLPPNQGDKTPKGWSNPCSAKWRSIVEASGGDSSCVSALSPSVSQIQDEEPQDKIPQPVKVIGRNRLKMVRCPILVLPSCQACSDPGVPRPSTEWS